jgi:hypothetical protein
VLTIAAAQPPLLLYTVRATTAKPSPTYDRQIRPSAKGEVDSRSDRRHDRSGGLSGRLRPRRGGWWAEDQRAKLATTAAHDGRARAPGHAIVLRLGFRAGRSRQLPWRAELITEYLDARVTRPARSAHPGAAPVPQARPSPDRPAGWVPASTRLPGAVPPSAERLAWMDRPTGRVIRRYERAQPGELVHVDVKKLGRLRDSGGHRVHGRDKAQHRGRDRTAGVAAAPAMTTSTPPSTTTRGWRMPRSWPKNRQPPTRGSCAAPGPSSPPTASASNGC